MSGRDDYETPEWLLARLRERLGQIAMDPATSAGNPANAKAFYTKEEDGLSQSWLSASGWLFLNPPFTRGAINQWVGRWAHYALPRGAHEMVCLTPVDATGWWRELQRYARVCAYLEKRLNYINPDTRKEVRGVRFPSALHYTGPRPYLFASALEDIASIQVLP